MYSMAFGGLALRRRPVAASGLTPISFTDNFNDSSKSANWAATTLNPGWDNTAAAGGTATETTVLTLNGFSASTYQFNGYSSASAISMSTGQSIWAKFTPTGNIIGSIGLFEDGNPVGRQVSIRVDNANGFSYASNNNAGSGSTFWGSGNSVAYDSTNHVWLRITNTGSQFEAYTAPDSAGTPGTWTLRGTTSAGYFTPSNVRVGVWAVVNNATPGSLVIDGFCTDA